MRRRRTASLHLNLCVCLEPPQPDQQHRVADATEAAAAEALPLLRSSAECVFTAWPHCVTEALPLSLLRNTVVPVLKVEEEEEEIVCASGCGGDLLICDSFIHSLLKEKE